MDEIAAVLEKLNQNVETFNARQNDLNKGIAELHDVAKKAFEPKPEASLTGTEAKLEESAVATLTGFKVAGIPAGAIVVSGTIAVFATELVDGFLGTQPPMMRGALKLGGAIAAAKWGKMLGKDGQMILVGLLAFDGIRDIFPIDQYAKMAAGKITGVLASRGLAAHKEMILTPAVGAKAAADYYQGAFKR